MILLIPPIQVKSSQKNEWLTKRKLKQEQKDENKEHKFDDISDVEIDGNDVTKDKKEDIMEENVEYRYCPFCNTELKKGSTICGKCGSELGHQKKQMAGAIKKNLQDFSRKIKIFENLIIGCFIALIFTIIVFPISMAVVSNNKLDTNEFTHTWLSHVDANNKSYLFETKNGEKTEYYIYQKENDNIICYRFVSGNSSQPGHATKSALANYFSNLSYGKPPISFTCPGLLVITIVLLVLEIGGLIALVFAFKSKEKEFYQIIINDDSLDFNNKAKIKANQKKYEMNVIPKEEYLLKKRDFLHKLIENKLKFLL